MDRRPSGVLRRALGRSGDRSHRAKARETWLAVKDRTEPSPFTLELMDELLGIEMMTHDPASAKERQR